MIQLLIYLYRLLVGSRSQTKILNVPTPIESNPPLRAECMNADKVGSIVSSKNAIPETRTSPESDEDRIKRIKWEAYRGELMEWGCSACGKLIMRSEQHLVIGDQIIKDKFVDPKLLVRMHMECSERPVIQ